MLPGLFHSGRLSPCVGYLPDHIQKEWIVVFFAAKQCLPSDELHLILLANCPSISVKSGEYLAKLWYLAAAKLWVKLQGIRANPVLSVVHTLDIIEPLFYNVRGRFLSSPQENH